MQRKNSILKMAPSKYKNGFAMITAIIVMIIIATIMTLSLSLSTETSKRTTDIYLHEQAELLTKSATERAMLEVANNGCQNSYNTQNDLFNVNINMQYIFTNNVGTCNMYINNIVTPEQNGSVLMDVEVVTKSGITTEPIRYFRRTIQKL